MEWSKLEKACLDIDTRLLWIWQNIEDQESFTLGELAAYVRAAYGQGYSDALSEPHGKLHRDNGYSLPPRVDKSK